VLVLGARDLDVARYELSWLGSAFGFGLLVAGFLGRRILSHGVEPVTRVGSVLVSGGVVCLAFGSSVPILVLGGLLQGAGCSALLIATPALIGTDDRARRLAVVVGTSSIAGLLAPGAIALADQVVTTGRIAVAMPLVWLVPIAARPLSAAEGLGIDRPVNGPSAPGANMTKDTWRRWLVIVLSVSGEFFFWTWGAARLVDAGAADDLASGLAAAFAVGMAVGRFLGPRSIGRLGPMQLSVVVASVGAASVMLDLGIAALVAALFVAGFGIALLYPISLARLLDDPVLREERLIALAAYASGVAITISPTVLGILDRAISIQYAFGLVPALLVGALTLHQRGLDPPPHS
jgi:MFS family permease